MPRLRELFSRYAARHCEVTLHGMPLLGPAGYLDRIRYRGGELTLEGWSDADSVRLRSDQDVTATAPGLPRADVAEAHGLRSDLGFRLSLPEGPNLSLEIMKDQEIWRIDVPTPSARLRRKSLRRCRMEFFRDLTRAAKHLPSALFLSDPAARSRVKSLLRLDETDGSHKILENRLFDRDGLEQTHEPVPITIVLPVYDAFDFLTECLAAVVENTDLPWHLVVIEDASPDPRVRPYLQQFAEWYGDRVTLLENPENLGFIGSVNRGLEIAIARSEHAVLLNSDAFVPEGWASRLIRPFSCHRQIASVTPMSNDATILSTPLITKSRDLAPGSAFAADAVAQSFNPEALISVLPTGVGFCLAMNVEYLRKVPQLDPCFGRGYGEEVDWCQKTRAIGGRHLGLPGLFVEHRGGESFGSEAKRALIRKNNKIISGRYPDFDAEVQRFIADDPMATARLAIGIAIATGVTDRPTPIYIAHSMGGGAEKYLQERIRGDLIGGGGAIVLRLGGPVRWRVELHLENGVIAGATEDFDFVLKLLNPIKRRDVVYSCAVGDIDPSSLPDMIQKLVRDGTQDRLEVLMHDYFALSPSYTLLDSDQVYRGSVNAERMDRAHQTVRPNGDLVTLVGWRAAWGRLLASAHEITVFSDDSRDQVLSVYPLLHQRVRVCPHSLLHPVPLIEPPRSGPEVIGVLGNIGVHKGAVVVAELARRLAVRSDMRVAILGTVDPAVEMPPSVSVSGSYHPRDISRLCAEHRITRWLIPSIWPETFSYTTHEALATGLPVHAFSIGAQGAAVARAANGVPIPFDPDADLAGRILHSIQPRPVLAGA